VAWWYVVFPAAFLLITTLAFNLLGDGIRDAMDPRTERLVAARRMRRRREKGRVVLSDGPAAPRSGQEA
jgi:peptide/nickel transport system permease protein